MKPATTANSREGVVAATVIDPHDSGGRADWPAILIGAVIAAGIASVFATFGAAVGMASIDPYEGDGIAAAAIIAVASWILWTTVSSVMAGAYVTGRMRRRSDVASPDERGIRDGIHGLAVWGVALALGVWLVASAGDAAAAMEQVSQPVATAGIDAEASGTDVARSSEAPVDGAGAQLTERVANNYAILSAFVTAAAMMIAAAGGYWAAGVGGRHRDESRTFARFGVWM